MKTKKEKKQNIKIHATFFLFLFAFFFFLRMHEIFMRNLIHIKQMKRIRCLISTAHTRTNRRIE